ncbi:MAG TPA: hypothetical protein VJT09_18160 [Pyrinomonadaceae bacterium]|nr:hypothetical protein [Pyrinomonadaceae bacterium]
MSVLLFFSIAVASGLLYPIIATIIKLRLTSRTASYPLFEQRSVEALPPTAQNYFRRLAGTLQAQGFSDAMYLYQGGQLAGTTCFLMLMKNHAAGDMVCAGDFHFAVKDFYRNTNYLEFATDLSNGVCINSNNTEDPSVFKPDPANPVFKFPGLKDSWRLYEAHRRLIARHAPGELRVLPSEGMEISHICSSVKRSLEKQVEYGYYYKEQPSGDYRPTWKGAVTMTFRVAWPVRDLKMAALRNRAAQTLRSLGL